MELRHEFTVPATVEETWEAFNDIESVAVCFPGATVSSVEGDTFAGSCKVKLGPIALVYNGTGTFVEKDEAAGRLVIDAKGKDKRGNGTAGAHVTATMTQEGTSTRVEVLTDLNITGKPAQFGRGVMQDVSDKLLGQFTQCLEQKVGDSSAATAAATAAAADSEPEAGSGTDSIDGGTDAGTDTGTDTDPVLEPAVHPKTRMHNMRRQSASETTPPAATPLRESRPANNEALDLGATVLPVIAKTYWKQALGVLLVLLVLRRLLRRH
jgi:carbon monoxide dehydrogenase subunit G